MHRAGTSNGRRIHGAGNVIVRYGPTIGGGRKDARSADTSDFDDPAGATRAFEAASGKVTDVGDAVGAGRDEAVRQS